MAIIRPQIEILSKFFEDKLTFTQRYSKKISNWKNIKKIAKKWLNFLKNTFLELSQKLFFSRKSNFSQNATIRAPKAILCIENYTINCV